MTDNAQSVYELSLIEDIPNIKGELKAKYGFDANFERAKKNGRGNESVGGGRKAVVEIRTKYAQKGIFIVQRLFMHGRHIKGLLL